MLCRLFLLMSRSWALAVRYERRDPEHLEKGIVPVAVATGGADCVVKTWELGALRAARVLE